jgi:peroxiredoxin
MALTESTMMKLGSEAPDFSLVATDGTTVTRQQFSGKPLLVMFICNHCPFVIHVASAVKEVTDKYADKIGVVGIQSNDTENYPADSFEKMKEEVANRGYGFPYAIDEDQSVAKAYTAACTPDFFLFDEKHSLVYRGRFDETRPTRVESGVYDSEKSPATGADMIAAIDAVLANEEVSEKQYPAMGCGIKWKSGNEPEYVSG